MHEPSDATIVVASVWFGLLAGVTSTACVFFALGCIATLVRAMVVASKGK